MDFISAVRSDGIQPLFTYVVPGGFATAPYFLLTISYMPQVELFWDRHPAAFTIVITFVVLFTGAFLEELGTRLELIWDRRLAHRNPSNWEPYLQLKVKDEIVGQRYLRNVLMRMKFELSMMLALPILTVGLAWLNVRIRFREWSTTLVVVATSLAAITAYLSWESYQSARLLHKTRQLVIDAVKATSG